MTSGRDKTDTPDMPSLSCGIRLYHQKCRPHQMDQTSSSTLSANTLHTPYALLI